MLSPVMIEFLSWVGPDGRTYETTMEAWRTNCPRQSVWEDALLDGLVRVDDNLVVLTDAGLAALQR
jgi:hypothetical protein